MRILSKYLSTSRLGIALFTACFLSIAEGTFAQSSVSLYVGDTWMLISPDPPQGAVFQTAWGCNHASVNVTKKDAYSAEIRINSYFTDVAQVQCDYYWQYYVGTRLLTNHATTYFNVTCRAVTLTLNTTNVTLYPGGSYSLSYSLRPTTSTTPSINFYSSNTDVAVVDQRGTIYAVASGSATITVKNSAGPSETCSVTVRDVAVTNATIPSDIYLTVDQQTTPSLSISPSNAVKKSAYWYIVDGTEYISLTSSGSLTGLNPGIAQINCLVNGNVWSNLATVHVSEPAFTLLQTSPATNATDIDAFVTPTVSFSLPIFQGDNYSTISLKENTGVVVDGACSISGSTLTFTPSKPLKEQTCYTLTIPSDAIKNRWGTHFSNSVTLTFTTGNYQKLSLSTSLPSGFVKAGTPVTLEASLPTAKIYYTTDGTTPDTTDLLYNGTITVVRNLQLRAVAVADGYTSSDILHADYLLSELKLCKLFPVNEDKMYSYKDVNPYVLFNTAISESEEIGNVQLIKNQQDIVECEIIVADSSLYIVPEESFEDGCTYNVLIPRNAIRTSRQEPNDSIGWSFKTTNYSIALATGGPELGCAIKNDGSLWTWGNKYVSGNVEDGSYTMHYLASPSQFVDNNVQCVSSGYMHHAIIKKDGSLWIWGRQYCGEFGNGSTNGSAIPVHVLDDVESVSCGGQTTAIIKNDGSLWMCGRNDFGQLGDSSCEHRNTPVKIMENVSSVSAGWCVTYAIKDDASLWAWGRNNKHQLANDTLSDALSPIKIMENVSSVATSVTEGKWTAVIKTDGSLWVWGESQSSPIRVMNNAGSVFVGLDYIMAIKNDGSLWAWGDNEFGQLGNGSTNSANSPIAIMDNCYSIAAGYQTTLAIKNDGSVWSWGRDQYDTRGDGDLQSSTTFHTTPMQVLPGKTVDALVDISSRKSEYRIKRGNKNVLIATPQSLGAVYNSITWNILNESIASVSNRGVITAKNEGETDVIIAISDGVSQYSTTCHVIVSDIIETNDGKFLIIFQNTDNTILQRDTLEYGALPVYRGATPTMTSMAQYTYTFAGWEPEIVPVTGDATYTATYVSHGTGFDNVAEKQKPIKVIENGKMYILMPDGSKYSAAGQRVE